MATVNKFDFGDLFVTVEESFERTADLSDLNNSFSDVLVTSAIAKCLDYNQLAYQSSSRLPSFFLVSNVRAICEELIYCALFKRLGQTLSDQLVGKLNHLALLRNVRAQTNFFALNNKLQPTLGGFTASRKQDEAIDNATIDLKRTWQDAGFTRAQGRVPPTVRQISNAVGLETTYEYTYHLTSNFVHFNPGQLFRLGWGPMKGPFTFSCSNFEGYFSNLARFLGVLVFYGYCHIAPDKFASSAAKRYATEIATQLKGNFRWPEITTYEEMNRTWPDSVMVRSLMTVWRQEHSKAMPDVMSELEALRDLAS